VVVIKYHREDYLYLRSRALCRYSKNQIVPKMGLSTNVESGIVGILESLLDNSAGVVPKRGTELH
jgi:hypothetical protein